MENLPPRGDNITKYNLILRDLRIISNINKNDKLIIKNNTIIIQPYSSRRAFIRWWNGYNREDSKFFIDKLFKKMLYIYSNLTNLSLNIRRTKKKRRYNNLKKRYEEKREILRTLCQNTKKGLLHLMITYKDDGDFTDFINQKMDVIKNLD